MSRITDAFAGTLNAQERARGERLQATVGSVTADCIIGDSDFNELLAAGGVTEAGGVTLQMRADEFDTMPEKLTTAVSVGGRSLTLLRLSESHGVYSLICGDPVSNE